jgi:hypothetical protein
MADDNERGGAGQGAKEARQDRLKLALRENLKRRKAQARERGQDQSKSEDQVTELSSCDFETSLHGQVGKRGD